MGVTASMKRRDMVRKLRAAGCKDQVPDAGRHTKWLCPCEMHTYPLPRHGEISPGVVADAIKRLPCLPKGWIK